MPNPREHLQHSEDARAPKGAPSASRLTAVLFSSALALGIAMFTPAVARSQAAASAPYLDPRLPIAQRVDDLLGRMTLEEKVAQMLCLWEEKRTITDSLGRFDPTHAPEVFRLGIGRIERPSEGHNARTEAEYTNAIQRWTKEHTRLGIPVIFHEEALHGLAGTEATSFPQAIALASTWSAELVERVFATAAAEVRARGAQQVLAPVIDIARDPRWGRIEETYGEDPYLVSRMGVAAVNGFQGGDVSDAVKPDHVIATLKHMSGHGQPESGSNTAPAPLGERTLRNFFFPPFEAAVKEAHAGSVMPSYNEIDGIPSHANAWMLRDVLRGEWGFKGSIVSDWSAIPQLAERHHLAADLAGAARRALTATVDADLPDAESYITLVGEVRAGRVPEAAIDSAVRRLLRVKFALGLFENPYVDPARADAISGAAKSRALALEAAQDAIVLLRNEGSVLPLDAARLDRVAVIGPHAAEVLLGGYSGTPRTMVSILDGIRQRVRPATRVDYAEGVRVVEDSAATGDAQPHLAGTRASIRWEADQVVRPDSDDNERRIAEAVALARRADVAIVVVGDNEMTSREAWSDSHPGDRSDLGLVGQQEELALAVIATGTPTVIVLINGRPLSIPLLAHRARAIVEGWYLGQETGTAIARVLFGDVNPGGKLPVSIARDVGQLPVFYDRKPSAGREYLFGRTTPLYPFGFGLSYTTFAYSPIRITPDTISTDGHTTVAVDVRNTGARAGDEVVQLYIRQRVSSATRPVRELKGFRRVTLKPGESRTVTFDIGPDQLSYYGADMKRVVEPGTFEVMIGSSSIELRDVTLQVR